MENHPMLIESRGAGTYLLSALEAAPDILNYLLRDLDNAEADFRSDPERFSIREVVAHLAEWDAIFLQRMKRTRDENHPTLVQYDEGQLALDHDYAHTSVSEQMRLHGQRRSLLTEFLRSLSAEEWQRSCLHPRAGRLTLEALATLVALHDAYHVRQITEWRRNYAAVPR
jgi:uncharacterized damage-inducible protein DinB